MDLEGIEPRKTLWALGEVWWLDPTGAPCRVPATIEDTSPSGACVRVKTAIEIGSSLTVKWHREQFAGVARNRRRDGSEFLVGIQRLKGKGIEGAHPILPSKEPAPSTGPASVSAPAILAAPPTLPRETPPAASPVQTDGRANSQGVSPIKNKKSARNEKPDHDLAEEERSAASSSLADTSRPAEAQPVQDTERSTVAEAAKPPNIDPGPAIPTESSTVRKERNAMESNPLFRKFWRHQQDSTNPPESPTSSEAPVSKSDRHTAESIPGSQSELLSCEDIYRACGILGVGSKYDIAKIVEMLNSKHIRELPKDVRRASVLMALDAAGTSVDEVLTDAARRQHALNSYETGQQKLFEQFEADKIRENGQINVEIERVAARYTDRIRQNLEQVAREKEAFRNWQAKKELEIQRIAEAVALCGKQPASEPVSDAEPELAKGAAAAQTSSPVILKAPAVPIR